MKRIKAGIIGTGFIGPAHVEAVRRLGHIDMVALAEADQALADAKAAALSIPKAYGDYRELLKDEEIEVIHNCTPNSLHFEITREAIAACKHVISEKPLAMNSDESRKLVAMAEESGLVHAIDFNYRYYPLVVQAREMRERGDLGKIYCVHGSYLQDWLFLDTDYNWRIEPDTGGESRAVADVGSHWCDLLQYITGLRITAVYADLATMIPVRKKPKKPIETYAGKELTPEDYEDRPITTEDYGSVLLEFDTGARGVFTVCQVAAGHKNRLHYEIDGSRCALVWDQEQPNDLWIGRRESANQVMPRDPSLLQPEAKALAHYPGGHPEGYPDGLRNFVDQVYTYIGEGKRPGKDPTPFSTFVDGHHEILIVEAVLESHRKKEWVKVKYDD